MSLTSLDSSRPHFLRVLPLYLVNVIFLILSTQTVGFVAVNNVHVVLFLAPLFYWTIHKPSVMPVWFIFLSGLIVDFAVDSFLGLHAFGFIIFYIILFNIRRIILSQPIFYHIIIYAFAAFIFEVVRWALVSILDWHVLPLYPSLLGFVLNVIAFLPAIFLLKTFHRAMAGYK